MGSLTPEGGDKSYHQTQTGKSKPGETGQVQVCRQNDPCQKCKREPKKGHMRSLDYLVDSCYALMIVSQP
jgi:hypothetical protein